MNRPGAMINRRGRVVESHRLVRTAFAISGAFGLAAISWAALVLVRGGSWWGPIHTFLLGTVLSAISGATQMFTVTWSSAPSPPRWLTLSQGGTLVTGAVLVLIGVPAEKGLLVWWGGALVAASLVLLAAILLRVIRRSLLRRFDLSMRFYLLALGCGVVGVTLGVLLRSGILSESGYSDIRQAHLHLNLIGLVGFTIIGTLPTLLPTFAHHRAVSGLEAKIAWWLCVSAAVIIGAGIGTPVWVIGIGTFLVGASAAAITSGIVFRLGRSGFSEVLPYLQVTAGVGWLTIWTVVDAAMLIGGKPMPSFSGWTAAAVAVGVGQVLVGSLAYLIPVLVGPPIGPNLRRLGHWPAIPLTAANLTGVFLAAGWPQAALATGILWFLDFSRRLATLRKPTAPD